MSEEMKIIQKEQFASKKECVITVIKQSFLTLLLNILITLVAIESYRNLVIGVIGILTMLFCIYLISLKIWKTTYILKNDSIHIYNKNKKRIPYKAISFILEYEGGLVVHYAYGEYDNLLNVHYTYGEKSFVIFVSSQIRMHEVKSFLNRMIDSEKSIIIMSGTKMIKSEHIRERKIVALTAEMMKVED